MSSDKRIVFDLEWNHDYQSNGIDYYGKAESFHGEIIQIGAVRLRDMEQFSLVLKPNFFPKLNRRVAKLTNLTQEMVDDGIEIREGLRQFMDWCGKNAKLIAWGGQDGLVLKQNLFLCGLKEEFPAEFFDLQAMFAKEFSLEKPEPALAEAGEFFQIPEEMTYHDALADARYAAEICLRMNWKNGVAKAKNPIRNLKRYTKKWGEQDSLTIVRGQISPDSWRLAPEFQELDCLCCGGRLIPGDHWQKSPDNKAWYALWNCPSCTDKILLRVKTQQEGRLWSFARGISVADEAMKKEWCRRYAIEMKRRKHRKCPSGAEFKRVILPAEQCEQEGLHER